MSIILWSKLADELCYRDKCLCPIIKSLGKPTIEFQTDRFRSLVESILSQQLAPKASQTIINRFRLLEDPFPKPNSIIRWRAARLRNAGVSPQKTKYLKALSYRWQDRLWRSGWEKLTDDQMVERLITVKGIGVWTAQMFLIFSMGRPDVLPTGDFGVRRGIKLLFKLNELPEPKEIPAMVPHWRGAASVASWYLWRALDAKILRESG